MKHASLTTSLHQLIYAMDRQANDILLKEFNLSFKRAYFLLTLQLRGILSQRELATALGYRPASVSTMLIELRNMGYIQVVSDPDHGRKKLVSLTPTGDALVTKGRQLLEQSFSEVAKKSGIDIQAYVHATIKLYEALTSEPKKGL